MELFMTRYMLILLILGISGNSIAEIVSFSEISIDVASDWTYSIEQSRTLADTQGGLISISHPAGIGTLRMMTYVAPDTVSRDRLRNLTNVPLSTTLDWQQWGDFTGYDHSYVENGSFFKQWWLSNESTVLLITYESDAQESQLEIQVVETMIDSISLL